MKTLREKTARKVYDILVEECGAREELREHFVQCQTTEEVREWRFCGKLGFGGKFWVNDDRLYVNCYNEDMNPARNKIIEAANKRLEAL